MRDIPPVTYAKTLYAELQKKAAKLPKPKSSEVEAAVIATVLALRENAKPGLTGGSIVKPSQDTIGPNDERRVPAEVIGSLKMLCASQGTAIALLGEAHEKSGDTRDTLRSQHVLGAVVGSEFGSSPLLIIEDGLQVYDGALKPYGGKIIREDQLTAAYPWGLHLDSRSQKDVVGLSIPQRSMAVAGYIVACLDGEGSAGQNKIILVFGAEHADIFTCIESLAEQVSGSLRAAARCYLIVQSQVKAKTKLELDEASEKLKLKLAHEAEGEQRLKDLKALPWQDYQNKYSKPGNKEEHDDPEDGPTEMGDLFGF